MKGNCPECKKEVDITIHEGTGQKILWVLDNPNVLHQCNKPRKYWCFQCGAPIPHKNPCIHKRMVTNTEKPKGALEYYDQ